MQWREGDPAQFSNHIVGQFQNSVESDFIGLANFMAPYGDGYRMKRTSCRPELIILIERLFPKGTCDEIGLVFSVWETQPVM